MSWFGKLFRDDPAPEDGHPALPADVDRFLPGGNEKSFRGSATAGEPHPESGTMVFRSGAGVSLVSAADAKRLARENAERNVAAALGHSNSEREAYLYAVQRRLEPVVEALAPPDAAEVAQITINSYGALIMNARSALFADIDTREDGDETDRAGANELAAARLRAVVEQDPSLGFRAYRTRNGWRYLCTSRLFDPAADETRQLLHALGADAKYVLLCRAQRCFRARLTPKPWRIGHRFFQVHLAETVSRKRLESYLKKAAPYATASFTAEAGQCGSRPPELELITAYHDQWCAAHSGKPLA